MKFNLKKVILLIVVGLFVFIPYVVFAETPQVIVNGQDIYDANYTDDTAKFDKNTNTLILDSYNGKEISFDGFDEATVNILLKGENIINSGFTFDNLEESDLGISGDIGNLKFTGEDDSTLSIIGYYFGIYNETGNIIIDDVTMNFGIGFTGVRVEEDGNIDINNSVFDFDEIGGGIISLDGYLTINKTTINAHLVEDLLGSRTGMDIIDSTVIADNVAIEAIYVYEGDLNITGSTLKLSDSDGALISATSFNGEETVLISGTSITASNITNDTGGESAAVIDVRGFKSFKMLNSIVDMENVSAGIYTTVPDVLYKDSSIVMEGIYSGIDFNNDFYDEATVTIDNCDMIFDNSNSDVHMPYAIYVALPTFDVINGSSIVITNNSNNELEENDIWLENHNYTDTPYEVALELGDLANPVNTNIVDSSIEIEALYTGDVSNKTPKTGILSMLGLISIDNSQVHISVDETGVALADVIIPGYFPDDALNVSGNVQVTNEGFDLRNYTYPEVGAGILTYDVDGRVYNIVDYNDFNDFAIQAMALLPSVLDIDGVIKITYDSNNGSGDKNTVNSNGVITRFPTDIFTSSDGTVITGWSLSPNGEKITSLNATSNTTLYAIWGSPDGYTYKFTSGSGEFDYKKVSLKTLKIDAPYDLFDKLEIDGIELIKNTDYTVSEGSTIITFTDSGISKLNTLKPGNYKITAKYTNSKNATYNFRIKSNEGNPGTYDNIKISIIIGLISLIGLVIFGFSIYKKRRS